MTDYIVRIISSRTGKADFVQITASSRDAARNAFNPVDGQSHGYWIAEAMIKNEFGRYCWNDGVSIYGKYLNQFLGTFIDDPDTKKYKCRSWSDLPANVKKTLLNDMLKDVPKFRKSQWA